MFGESESESPRAPSPWDTLTSASASSTPRSLIPISPVPKLVPEVEEGNIEYKLHLISPSPSRFARLVTQLKWRLLEGGGQAFYELGVADSGALVGLPRAELESSLETLEEMAGEIGASVVVVKEIEVPASLAEIVCKEDESAKDGWDPSRDPKLKAFENERRYLKLEYAEVEEESTTTSTSPEETETDLAEPDDCAAQGDVTAVFTMDLEPTSPSPPLEIEVASVYKPRPIRRRPPVSLIHDKRNRNRSHPTHGKKKWVRPNETPVSVGGDQRSTDASLNKLEHDKAQRRRRRDARRHTNTLPAHIDVTPVEGAATVSTTETETKVEDGSLESMVASLESLHVTIDREFISPAENTYTGHSTIAALFESPATSATVSAGVTEVMKVTTTQENESAMRCSTMVTETKQARLIVEALVVRKMSLDEGFLDFGGFEVV